MLYKAHIQYSANPFKAEKELDQIRTEIKQKEQLSLNSSMESSARLEALEISTRVIKTIKRDNLKSEFKVSFRF